MRLLGALWAMLLASNKQVDILKVRLQFGYDAAQEARSFVQDEEYKKAADSFADALNLGRKPALALQELDTENNDNNVLALQEEALEWLINVCCESSLLHLNQLEDLDSARSDAWAACVFSQYKLRQPIECMMKVCQKGNDAFGEFQACQQMLNLPQEQLEDDDDERQTISNRLKELEHILNNKK